MEFTLGLAQTCHPEDGDVVSLVDRFMARAKERGVDLLVFPECLMTRYEEELGAFLAAAQPLDGPFTQAVDALAAKHGLWVAYTLNEAGPDANHPYNTLVLTDDTGTQVGFYRKTHLFDTDFTRESDRMAAGNALFQPVDTPFGYVGMAICYDLRFPEVARCAALQGADLMLYPAAWVDGKLKAEQWRTLLMARAIENEMFVAGVSRADTGRIGQSCIVDPRGVIIAQGGPDEELVVGRIDTSLIDRVRKGMPVFSHRRPELYAGIEDD